MRIAESERMKKGFVFMLLAFLLVGLIAGLGVGSASESEDRKTQTDRYMKAGDYYILRGDFHIHSTKSDGRLSPSQRVTEANRYGYDVIAITDHANSGSYNTARKIKITYDEAKRAADSVGMILIRGFETGLSTGEHIVALNLPLDYEPLNEHNWSIKPSDKHHYQKRMKAITDAGGILIYAHPDFPASLKVRTQGYKQPIKWGIEQGYIQGVEVRNDTIVRFTPEYGNKGTFKDAFRWALDHNLIIFANSDVHKTRDQEMEKRKPTYTLVLATEPSESGVIEALLARRTIAWFQDMLWGREEHLKIFFDNLVHVRMNDNSGGITIENDSYVKLEGRIIDGYVNGERHEIGEAFTLTPEGSASITTGVKYDYIDIEWKNAYKEPDVTLTLRYDI